jgi:Rod binding domain-containing protein
MMPEPLTLMPPLPGGAEKPAGGKTETPATPEAQALYQKKLKKAVKDFEALFIYEMLKEMRQTTNQGPMEKGLGKDVYGSLFDMEVAKLMSERGMGLGDMLLKQLQRRDQDRAAQPELTLHQKQPLHLKGTGQGQGLPLSTEQMKILNASGYKKE